MEPPPFGLVVPAMLVRAIERRQDGRSQRTLPIPSLGFWILRWNIDGRFRDQGPPNLRYLRADGSYFKR